MTTQLNMMNKIVYFFDMKYEKRTWMIIRSRKQLITIYKTQIIQLIKQHDQLRNIIK